MSIHIDVECQGLREDEDGWKHNLWLVQLVRYHNPDTPEGIEDSRGQAHFHTEFRTGLALGEPTAEDVLESLLMDAQGVRYEGVDDWIESYGFEIKSIADARKLEATYDKIVEQTARLAEFVGGQDVLDRFLDMDSDEAAREMVNL